MPHLLLPNGYELALILLRIRQRRQRRSDLRPNHHDQRGPCLEYVTHRFEGHAYLTERLVEIPAGLLELVETTAESRGHGGTSLGGLSGLK
jgi:hypothetical protein